MISQVFTTSIGGDPELVLETHHMHLEAPNWTRDSRALVLNGDGVLWRFDLGSHDLDRIPISGVPELNNDHVLDIDGEHAFVSANDGHIYRAPLAGGRAERVTNETGRQQFLHGVSHDGSTLAYVGLEPGDGDVRGQANIFTIPAQGGPDHQVTFGTAPADGCEFSPDDEWIYFNTEAFSPGQAQIARIPVNGGEPEQLTFDERVNWFPHLSPDGTAAVYLSYPLGTTGHPGGRDVELCVVADDWSEPVRRLPLWGGQGTINVPSWSPTGDRFAYVAYQP
ncbi:TolB family protein [Sinomonas terrae]|uniref:Biopolymer transporter Tol n=1 Tax=Sinomonas terrae TaxID=2908838 RepID=A0ABS9U2N2_9MICC|nr:biopolymer transporter Tol [Sinomonas terrae]MCH6470915.1 biopolymer transporter Tol [Sinomonas terrae]